MSALQRASRLLGAVVCLTVATPSFASPFCKQLERLTSSQNQHAIALPPEQPEQAAICRSSIGLSGARHTHCSWTFPYRSYEALSAFQGVIRAVTSCLGPNAVMSMDQSVNHPDAYDLRMFTLLGQEFAVSLKDKGALQQTLVFVRVEQR